MRTEPTPPRLPPLSEMSTLTACERRVLTLIGCCLSDAEIAKRLCRSRGTIRFHLYQIRQKLGGVERREHLALIAVQRGLTPPPASR